MGALPNLPPYVYRCVDRSWLVDGYRNYWARWFVLPLPRSLPANFVTLASSACMWTLLGLVMTAGKSVSAAQITAFVVLLQIYLIYDHVDGMQAKRTGTSSALGEFLDHYLDVYHGAIAVLAVFALVDFQPRWLVLVMLWCSHLAFAATMVEEKERGELYFGVVGSLEGVLLFSAMLFSWLAPVIRGWWLAPLAGGINAFTLFAILGGCAALVAVVDCLRRIGRMPPALLFFSVGSLVLLLAIIRGPAEFWPAAAMLTLYCGDYTGRVIGSHLLHRPSPLPDFLAPAALLIFSLVPSINAGWTWVVLLYLAVRTLWGVAQIIYPLRHTWRWSNATPTPAPTVG